MSNYGLLTTFSVLTSSVNPSLSRKVWKTFLCLVAFAFVTTSSVAARSFDTSPCHGAVTLAADGHRQIPAGDRAIDWIEVQIPETGVLDLDVKTPGDRRDQPLLGYWGAQCRRASNEESLLLEVLDRTPGHLTLRLAAGTALFRVVDQQGLGLASRLDLTARFLADSALAPPPTKGGEDDEIIEMDGLVAPPEGALLLRRCHLEDGDDHGNFAACATSIGDFSEPGKPRQFQGTLDSQRDTDFFRLELTASAHPLGGAGLWQVRVENTDEDSDVDLFFTLYDSQGQRLAVSSEASLAAALGQGVYYLRVEARGAATGAATGPYRFAISAQRW